MAMGLNGQCYTDKNQNHASKSVIRGEHVVARHSFRYSVDTPPNEFRIKKLSDGNYKTCEIRKAS